MVACRLLRWRVSASLSFFFLLYATKMPLAVWITNTKSKFTKTRDGPVTLTHIHTSLSHATGHKQNLVNRHLNMLHYNSIFPIKTYFLLAMILFSFSFSVFFLLLFNGLRSLVAKIPRTSFGKIFFGLNILLEICLWLICSLRIYLGFSCIFFLLAFFMAC